MANENISTGFRINRDTLAALKKRLPRRGDRTKLINHLIEKFLKGEIVVVLESRRQL